MEVIRYVARHPLNRDRPLAAIWRFAAWQVRSRVAGRALWVPFVDDTVLVVARGMTGATGNIYCGLHEFEEMALVLHALRPGDLFLDVGANVGTYTVLASGVVGARTMAIEPVPSTSAALRANVEANGLGELVTTINSAIGERAGAVHFTLGLESMNRVAVATDAGASLVVPMTTLDSICLGRAPVLAKIDVEGHEREVLRGAQSVLAAPSMRAAIVEVWDDSRDEVMRAMAGFGFAPHAYDPATRILSPRPDAQTSNVVFVRDLEWLQARCMTAPPRLVRAVGKRI